MTADDRFSSPSGPSEPPPRGRSRLIPLLIGLFAAVGMIGGGWVGWTYWHTVGESDSYTTPRGAQRTVSLADGSQMQMDSATLIETRFSKVRREVVLTQGQVYLDVVPEPEREFYVIAGDVRVRVVGTQLMVRHTGGGLDAGQVRVQVQSGSVLVMPSGAGRATVAAGQTVLAGAGRLGSVQPFDADAFAVWRDGQVTFQAAPLAQALDEFERYTATGVILRDAGIAQMPLSGTYALSDFPAFLASLPEQLPIRLVQREQGTEILAREP